MILDLPLFYILITAFFSRNRDPAEVYNCVFTYTRRLRNFIYAVAALSSSAFTRLANFPPAFNAEITFFAGD